jgi:large subunit ribosomal protein L18
MSAGGNNKKNRRVLRAKRVRKMIARQKIARLSAHRSGRHIYAQIIAPGGAVVAAASSLSLRKSGASGATIAAAAAIGKMIAEGAKEKNIAKVAFDRGGFKYHGRIRALAEAAREGGLQF